jgi:hypothetical protein
MSFKNFLLEQIDRKDRVGALAKRVKRSTSKYSKIKSYEDIYYFLYQNNAVEEEFYALKLAFDEYSEE